MLSAAGDSNPELICLRELLEFKNDWKYVINKGRHSLPLISRSDLERHIVERIFGLSYFDMKRFSGGEAFKPPTKDGNTYMFVYIVNYFVYKSKLFSSFQITR